MTTVDESVVRESLGQLLDSVASGEEVRITRQGKFVARILPVVNENSTASSTVEHTPIPDFTERMKAYFPNGPLLENFGTIYLLDERDEREL